jgi:GalNAc-alpha-(1->4)-GalNAc-alpha-(1->3)-diNAcBac-PP-undecaprenol alpha-1,4-N-acetyl-D-galactosaminyltransferase
MIGARTGQRHSDKNKPTVVLVTGTLQAGGAERQLSQMANYWAAKDWKVILATWSGPELADFYSLHARVVREHLHVRCSRRTIFARVRANLNRVLKLRKLLSATRPDALLSFMTESNLLTILAGVGFETRVIVSERIHPALHTSVPRMWRILRRLLYVRADDVVAQTRDAAQWLESHCRTSVSVIPNALRVLPEPSGERRSMIVSVGRLTYQKGFDLLLRAFARIAPRFGHWKLVIIGEGDERQSLATLRRELMLDDRVEFVGQIPDVVDWMVHAGLVVQPSRFEGFPNVVLESMGLGAPVISADCRAGPSEMIEDGVNGRLVPVEDVEALAHVMADLISRPDERAKLGRAASRVRDRYGEGMIMSRWEACLFPRLAKSRAPKRKP